MKCEFVIVFNDYQYCSYVTFKLSDNKTLIPWKSWLEEVIEGLKSKGYTFNQIAEKHIVTIANIVDMSYDFHIKCYMGAVEWKLNAMINKNKSLINKFGRNWRHHLNRKFEIIVFDYRKTFNFVLTCFWEVFVRKFVHCYSYN